MNIIMFQYYFILFNIVYKITRSSGVGVPLEQVSALEDFYEAANGQFWDWRYPASTFGNIWNFSSTIIDPCDSWQGVGCNYLTDGTTAIVNITLPAYNLSGTLSSSLSNISTLTTITLDLNYITGTFPIAWCNLLAISTLSLRDNLLEGHVPGCLQQNLTSLRSLSLHENQFHGKLQPFGKLVNLRYLSYSNNFLSGELPSSMSELTNLVQLYLLDNLFVGGIKAISNLSLLIDLSVSTNLLSSALPETIGNLKSMVYLYLEKNLIPSSIPQQVEGMTKLVYFTLYENRFTGFIPDSIGNCNRTIFFSVDNNFVSGPLPSSISNWKALQQFNVYNNLLTGTLLASFSQLARLNLILVQENLFTGNPELAFNRSIQKDLQIIDIASNPFTGTISVEMFGEALLSFSAYDVCFTGGFPDAMCDSKHLRILVIDGITSWCSKSIWPSIPNSPKYSHSVPYGIPDCVWTELVNLTTLHASGNGLTDSIPHLTSYAQLTNIDLSFNHLTGTIPDTLQTWSMLLFLDLQSNKLVGSIASIGVLKYGYDDDSSALSLNLNTNRLSGIIPNQLEYAENMNIVEGNLFSCSYKHEPPKHDPNSASFACGSSLLNISLYIFLAVAVIVILFAAVLMYYIYLLIDSRAQVSHFLHWWSYLEHAKLVIIMKNWQLGYHTQGFSGKVGYGVVSILVWITKLWQLEGSPGFVQNYPHFRQFIISLRTLRNLTVVISFILLLAGLSLYSQLKLFYGTYSIQYMWRLSGAFLSGYQPALALILLWMVLISFSLSTISYYIPRARKETIVDYYTPQLENEEKFSQSSSDSGLSKVWTSVLGSFYLFYQQASRRSTWISLGLLTINMIFILGLKSAFVYLLVSYKSSFYAKVLLELTLGLVDVMWSSVLVPFLINNLPRKTSTSRMMLKVIVLLINSLVTSCLAIIVTDSSCFEGLFVKENSLTENFIYTYCNYYNYYSGACVEYISYPSYRQYTPQFFYNYNCYSAVITEYVPIFFMSYCILMLLIPLGSWLAVRSSHRNWIILFLYPEIFWTKNTTNFFTPKDRLSKTLTELNNSSEAVEQSTHSPIQFQSHELCLSTTDMMNECKERKVSENTLNSLPEQGGESSIFSKQTRKSRLLFPGFILASAIHHLLIALTFGIIYPPLSLAVALLACCTNFTWEVLIGRWLFLQSTSEDGNASCHPSLSESKQPDATSRIDEVCAYVCCGPRKCAGILAYSSAIFIGLASLDIAGDKVGWEAALWAPLSTIVFASALLLYISRRHGYGAYVFAGLPQAELTAAKALEEVVGEDPVDYKEYRNREMSRIRLSSIASMVSEVSSSMVATVSSRRPKSVTKRTMDSDGVTLGSIIPRDVESNVNVTSAT